MMVSELRNSNPVILVSDRPGPIEQTKMFMTITGMIESGQIPDQNGICCKYDFMSGQDW